MDPICYSALPLERAHLLRRDPEALARLLSGPDKLVTLFWRELSLVSADPAVAHLLSGTEAAQALDRADQVVFLGMAGGRPLFAADLSGIDPESDGQPPELGLPARWVALRTFAPALPHGDCGILAYARGMLLWNRAHRFCGRCGAPAESREGGHLRVCLDHSCAAQHYPRTDPAVIMRVTDGESILLHRQPAWPPGMWSVMAGFVECGETLEEAVAREVREETGIEVADVAYAGSQPWPFPSSLMLGFTARAAGGTLAPDPHELDDARWFGREQILAEFDDRHRTEGGGLFLPSPISIARRLIEDWLRRP